jgi:hypothetical protein
MARRSYNPIRSIALYFLADIPAGSVANVTIYGVAQTWFFIGDVARGITAGFNQSMGGFTYAGGFAATGLNTNRLAIRWE